MSPEAAATRARLLDAAFEEFARYGVAGARVDRIAARAQANKRLIYVHFGNKERLFEAVVDQTLGALTDAVAFTADDLPGYAGALFDHLVRHPRLLRVTLWQRLERPELARSQALASYRPRVDALAARGTPHHPVDVLTLVLAVAGAWLTVPYALRELAPEGGAGTWSPQRLAAHRAAVVAAVRGVVEPRRGEGH